MTSVYSVRAERAGLLFVCQPRLLLMLAVRLLALPRSLAHSSPPWGCAGPLVRPLRIQINPMRESLKKLLGATYALCSDVANVINEIMIMRSILEVLIFWRGVAGSSLSGSMKNVLWLIQSACWGILPEFRQVRNSDTDQRVHEKSPWEESMIRIPPILGRPSDSSIRFRLSGLPFTGAEFW